LTVFLITIIKILFNLWDVTLLSL